MTGPGEPAVGWEAPDPDGPAAGIVFAPHGARLVAYLIDALIVTVVSIVLVILVGFVFISGASLRDDGESVDVSAEAVVATLLLTLAVVLLVLLYFPFFWARGGQTPGMVIFGLRVVDDRTGGRIGWGTAGLRMLGMFVASAVFYLGFAWILIDKRRRGFHDLIAGTVVVKRS
jgi:uncharacterized RDD family membrane protein YckC